MVSAVMRMLKQSVMVKRELLLTLTCGHQIWVVTKEIRLRIQGAEMSFPCRVTGLSLRDRVRSLAAVSRYQEEPVEVAQVSG